MTRSKILGAALAALFVAACSTSEPPVAPSQVSADGDAELLAASLSSDFFEAQGPLGAAMGLGIGMPMVGTYAGMGMAGPLTVGMQGSPMGPFSGGTMGAGMGPGMGPGGMNVTRTVTFYDKAGTVQAKYDSLATAKVVTDEKVSAASSMTVNGNSRTMTMEATHHTTVTGLEGRETQVTVNANGTSKVTMGATRDGKTVTTTVTASDATVNLVVPVPRARGSYPKSGSTTHERTIAATDGTNSQTHSYKEVTTFDGSATAKVTVTVDGQVKNCTRSLETARLTCS